MVVGVDYDPYKDEGGECDDAISKFFEPYSGKGGLFSTWRERHIAIQGVWAGLRAAQFADIPDTPPLWEDEDQYYKGAAIISNVVKIYGTSAAATLGGVLITLKTINVI